MKQNKVFTNPKFPNTSIDIAFDTVYGGGIVKEYKGEAIPQVMNMAKKALSTFVEEIQKDGWS